ncbi:thioredoxin domain-containing protein [Desulfovibrio sp. ZJ369]|uniref:DsbA family protein n=1 Tax=Desulfovibrio sp. ZJ369 TaxID=2709793 RepID=UPI0013ED3BD9|nr:thioredoxin domain-containing protein [Desulfovibrio sp. ZJ369]
MSDRLAVEVGVKAEIAKDLSQAYRPLEALSGRTCLDGRPVDGFQGDILEYWSNLECPYCGIQEPLQAQRDNPNLCIVVRHIPSDEYGESLKKALAYEALRGFSLNAAHRFWDAVLPKTTLGIPVPYEAALQTAMQEAAIAPEALADALQAATSLVSADIVAAQSRITSTPTWILNGIRFPACDFTAAELPTALELSRQVRAGDTNAQERVAGIITRGLLNESLL